MIWTWNRQTVKTLLLKFTEHIERAPDGIGLDAVEVGMCFVSPRRRALTKVNVYSLQPDTRCG